MDSKKFENLQFDTTINCITAENYPCKYPLHWHQYIELAAVLEIPSGTANPTAQISKDTYELQEGDILFFWPGELHQVTKCGKCAVIGIQFSALFFNRIPDFAAYLQAFRNCHVLRAAEFPQLTQSIAAHLQKILDLQARQVEFESVKSLICTYELFIELAAHLRETMSKYLTPKSESAAMMKKIATACAFISENCESDLSLETVAAHVGFSNSYFSRTFRKVTGYHFVEYVTLQRVQHAQILLSDPNLSITEICYMAGFKSSSSFNRAFLQYNGCSPSDCRRYYLEK